jgi:hypothetical protein
LTYEYALAAWPLSQLLAPSLLGRPLRALTLAPWLSNAGLERRPEGAAAAQRSLAAP